MSTDKLKQRLQRLEAQIATEKSTLAEYVKQAPKRQQELQSQKKQLTQLVLAAIESQNIHQHQLKLLEQDFQEAQTLNDANSSHLQEVQRAFLRLGQSVQIILSELPHLKSKAATLRQTLQEVKPEKFQRFDDVAVPFVDLLKSASEIKITTAEIHTANGELQQVELLTIGLLGFAYLASDGALGLSLASPHDAQGFRWTEHLETHTQKLLMDLFANNVASTNPLQSHVLPIDPSGQLRKDPQLLVRDFWTRLKDGGWLMLPLAAVALIALFLAIDRLWFTTMQKNKVNLLPRVLKLCTTNQYDAAQALIEGEPGTVARTLGACLKERQRGSSAMEDAIQIQLLHELPRLQRRLGALAVLAAVAPLLGLLGTVTGIIRSFGAIEQLGNSSANLMAGGISEALLTTATGLVVAIPILLLHSLLSGRVDHLISRTESEAAILLGVLVNESRDTQ